MSEIRFNCSGCGGDLTAPEILLGAEICCDACNTKQNVPDPEDEFTVNFFCAGCGEALSVAEDYIGQNIRCDNCNTKMTVPEQGKPAKVIEISEINEEKPGSQKTLIVLPKKNS